MSELREQFITTPSGKKTAVILPIKEYEKLLEDLHDLAVVAERQDEASISLQEMKERLRQHDLV